MRDNLVPHTAQVEGTAQLGAPAKTTQVACPIGQALRLVDGWCMRLRRSRRAARGHARGDGAALLPGGEAALLGRDQRAGLSRSPSTGLGSRLTSSAIRRALEQYGRAREEMECVH